MPADKVQKQYFAQVGTETIEFSPDGELTTSAPIYFYRVRATKGKETYEGVGPSLKEAEADVDKQMGKVKP